MKKIFVSALAVLNLLFASAQEEKMDISFTPAGGNIENTTKEEIKPVETQQVAMPQAHSNTEAQPAQTTAVQTNVSQPAATQQNVQQSSSASSSASTASSSDDFDSDFFASNNTASQSGETKNVVGLRFGASISQATSSGVASAHLKGLAFGVVDQVWFGERNLFIETGLMYLQKGYTLKDFEPSETKVYYVELPLLWCFRQGREDLCMILKAGGYIACGTKGTLKTDISDNPGAIDAFKTIHEYDLFKEGALTRFDAGAKFGVAIVVRRVHFGFSYDLGLYKIDKKDLIYGDDELMLGYKDLKNRSFQLMVGFNFQK